MSWIASCLSPLAFWTENEELADRESDADLNDNASNWEASSAYTYEEEETPKTSPDRTPVELTPSPTRSRSSSSVSNRRGNVSSSSDATGQKKAGEKKKKRRRSISWGGWTAPDIVGIGRDMVKGLRVGQSQRRGMGSVSKPLLPSTFRGSLTRTQFNCTSVLQVIPVVVNMNQGPEALADARGTVHSYCLSHNLLLRGLVIVPSILSPRSTSTPVLVPSTSFGIPIQDQEDSASGYAPLPFAHHQPQPSASRRRSGSHLRPLTPSNLATSTSSAISPATSSPPLSPRSSFYHLNSIKRNALLDQSLRTDVTQTLGLVDNLLPALRRDGGRILAAIPSGWGDGILRDSSPVGNQLESSLEVEDVSSERKRGRRNDARGTSLGLYEQTSSPSRSGDALAGNVTNDGMVFCTIRESLKIMWKEKRRELKKEGVQISLVVTAPTQSSDLPSFLSVAKSQLHIKLKEPETSNKKASSARPWASSSTSRSRFSFSSLVHDVFETLYFITNPASHVLEPQKSFDFRIKKLSKHASFKFSQLKTESNEQAVDSENEGEFISRFPDRRNLGSESVEKASSRSSEEEEEVEMAETTSPLFESILSALSRSKPRNRYVNGLGPRIEGLIEEIAGARYAKESLAAWLRG